MRPVRMRTVVTAAVAHVLATGLVLGMVPASAADERDRAFPSRDEVASAERRVADTAARVGAIKASLLMANQRLEAAAVEAEKASEAYNGAMWRFEEAKQEVRTATAEARAARRTVEEQRRAVGALVASSYQQAGQLTALSAMMGAEGPEGVLDEYAAFHGASKSLRADYDRFAASDALAQVFEDRAREARAEQQQLAQQARAAKEQATTAAETAQVAAVEIAEEKDRLIRELARAQDISVSLARRRQAALEEIARERAAERARVAAEAQAREQAREAAQARAAARSRARAAAREQAQQAARARTRAERRSARRPRSTDRDDAPVAAPQPVSPPPAPAPPPPATPSGSGGADRAVSFARAQLGEPYVWGAAGPDSWDCSGLMLQAWAQSGVSLPHYSVAQYYAGTPVSPGDLRPGDLVFWGSSNDPGSIFHVAMYIGGGQIVHAPRTGRPVSIDSMYYWTPPNFFARV